MTVEQLKNIIAQGEGTTIEFKTSRDKLPRNVYESICAFLNCHGGHILLGVADDGAILGVNPEKAQDILDALARELHNPQIMDPATYIPFEKIEIDGKIVIYGYVVESSSMHRYLGKFYDRNQDGDFEAKSVHELAEIVKRKEHIQSERWVYPQLSIEDLEPQAFDKLRKAILANNPTHEWLSLSNHLLMEYFVLV